MHANNAAVEHQANTSIGQYFTEFAQGLLKAWFAVNNINSLQVVSPLYMVRQLETLVILAKAQ